MTSKRSIAAIVALAATLTLASAGAAPAAFPGRNGLIAFRSDTSEAVSPQLFSIAPNGSGRRNLTRNLYANVSGSWSPDGRTIAFSWDGDVWLMDSDGSRRRALVEVADTASALGVDLENVDSLWAPAWSPDGRQLAFLAYFAFGPRMDFMAALTVDLATGEVDVRLTDLESHNTSVDWSPDGKSVVVGAGRVFVVPVGGKPVDVTATLPGESTDGTWQPLCTAYGSARGDGMHGSLGSDILCGLGGSDRMYGGAGSDRLFGGDGNDVIRSADGIFDVIGCGSGRDEVTADRVDLVGVDCESVTRA